jgi:hypothetical protein
MPELLTRLTAFIHWVSFGLGFAAACILIWAIMTVGSWLKSIFQPAGSLPFGQRLKAAFRNLIFGLLFLAVLAVVGYIVYWVLVKPVP